MDYMKVARKWLIYYRTKYDKLNLNAVVSKVVAEVPEIKNNIREIIPEIKKLLDKISKISKEEALSILENEYPEMLERKKEQRQGLPPLPNAEKGKVITRFAPNPNGYLHIGHSRAIILSYEYARMYDGKFILRLEDTDPKVKKPLLEAYEKIPEDVKWLIEDEPDEFYIQSERLEIYYEYARKLIEMGKAYVDLSSPETIREYRNKGIPTEFRDKSIEWHLEEWEKMLNGEYDEGQAVLRIKTDLSHPNPSVRDWIAFRIVNPKKNPHPWLLNKYGKDFAESIWVWPTYNFSVSIDDHLMGVTHVFRMKEHAVNAIKQKYIFDYFGWRFPTVINYGPFMVKDLPFHKSEIRKLLEEGKISGWCDPFLANLCSLRRRGIHPKAIKRYVIEVGINPVEVTIDWNRIFRYNREVYDKQAKRLFYVENPVLVEVSGLPLPKEITLKNHPDVDLGKRTYNITTNLFYLDRRDVEKSKYIRLMEAFNIEIVEYTDNKIKARYIDDNLETIKKLNGIIVQWIPYTNYRKIKVWKPEGIVEGIAESYIESIKDEEVVHFIRYGFLKREGDKFIWMHK